ncbi:MAG: hypothetical protein IT378_10100 [Sandaracinaceae bacterium]|nr:hypothetical protein [Sandaracinaceae bacterium]
MSGAWEPPEEVERRLERARRAPGTGRCAANAPPRLDLRWSALRRFPYSLLIGLVNGERLVVAVAHQRRRPGYWLERLE